MFDQTKQWRISLRRKRILIGGWAAATAGLLLAVGLLVDGPDDAHTPPVSPPAVVVTVTSPPATVQADVTATAHVTVKPSHPSSRPVKTHPARPTPTVTPRPAPAATTHHGACLLSLLCVFP